MSRFRAPYDNPNFGPRFDYQFDQGFRAPRGRGGPPPPGRRDLPPRGRLPPHEGPPRFSEIPRALQSDRGGRGGRGGPRVRGGVRHADSFRRGRGRSRPRGGGVISSKIGGARSSTSTRSPSTRERGVKRLRDVRDTPRGGKRKFTGQSNLYISNAILVSGAPGKSHSLISRFSVGSHVTLRCGRKDFHLSLTIGSSKFARKKSLEFEIPNSHLASFRMFDISEDEINEERKIHQAGIAALVAARGESSGDANVDADENADADADANMNGGDADGDGGADASCVDEGKNASVDSSSVEVSSGGAVNGTESTETPKGSESQDAPPPLGTQGSSEVVEGAPGSASTATGTSGGGDEGAGEGASMSGAATPAGSEEVEMKDKEQSESDSKQTSEGTNADASADTADADAKADESKASSSEPGSAKKNFFKPNTLRCVLSLNGAPKLLTSNPELLEDEKVAKIRILILEFREPKADSRFMPKAILEEVLAGGPLVGYDKTEVWPQTGDGSLDSVVTNFVAHSRRLDLESRAPVVCSLCEAVIQSRHLESHTAHTCPCRPLTCAHCDVTVPFRDLDTHHNNECQSYPVKCEHHCGKNLKRSQLGAHSSECPRVLVVCRYASVGCEDKVRRNRILTHYKDNAVRHLEFVERRQTELLERVSALEQQVQALTHEDDLMEDA